MFFFGLRIVRCFLALAVFFLQLQFLFLATLVARFSNEEDLSPALAVVESDGQAQLGAADNQPISARRRSAGNGLQGFRQRLVQ